MKILAVIGSPRNNGNTYEAVKLIEDELNIKNPGIEFEYVQLGSANLKPCKGCFICIERGEEKCPLRDGRETLEFKMQQADGMIFASPVYTYNLPWIMKNFLDRFAYRCHRPDFHGKKAMVVVSTGAVGLGFVAALLSLSLGTMGFITCAKLGITFPPAHERNDIRLKKEMSKLVRKTEMFYERLLDTKPEKPSFIKLLQFVKQKRAYAKAPQDLADFKFWRDKGWLAETTDYYYEVRAGKMIKLLVYIISKLTRCAG